jgi:hypothetical protein
MMSSRAAKTLAWALPLVAVFLAALSFAARSAVGNGPAHQSQELGSGALALFQLGLIALGALIASRQPRNPIGWLLAGYGFLAALAFFVADTYAYLAIQAHVPLHGPAYALVFESVVTGPAIFGLFAILFLIFPNGRPLSPNWRRVLIVAIIATLVASLASAVAPGPLNNVSYEAQNPLGLPGLRSLVGGFLMLSFIALLVTMVSGAISLVLRFRRSHGDERQQLKWVATAVAFAAVLLASGPLFWFNVVPPAFGGLWSAFFLIAVGVIPISIGIAMLKYRLYDIDVIINRALVYGPLTLTIALMYIGGVIALQTVFRALTGQHSDLAIAIATLAVAAVFNPWRRRLQVFIDRRFYRHKYDASRTLSALSTRLRDEVDLDQMAGELTSVIQETMQPDSVSLWLRPGGSS